MRVTVDNGIAYFHLNQPNLGWIAAVIGLVATGVTILVSKLAEKKQGWDGWTQQEKQQFVREAIMVGKEAVRQGKAPSVEAVVQQLVSEVWPGNWQIWKESNPTETNWIRQADQQMMNGGKRLGISSSAGIGLLIGAGLLFSYPKLTKEYRKRIKAKLNVKPSKSK